MWDTIQLWPHYYQGQREEDKRRESPPGSSSFSRLASLFRPRTTSVSVFLSSAVHPSFKAVFLEPLTLHQTPSILFTSSPIKSAPTLIPPLYFFFFSYLVVLFFCCLKGYTLFSVLGWRQYSWTAGTGHVSWVPMMGKKKKHGVSACTRQQGNHTH